MNGPSAVSNPLKRISQIARQFVSSAVLASAGEFTRRPGRRWVFVLIGLATVGLAALSLGGVIRRQQDDTWARIQRERVVRVGLDPSFPPFEVDNAGQIVGYDVDLAHALAERWGVEVWFVPISFDGLIDGLLAGQYDLIISAYPYDPRLTRVVAYSEPYFNAGQVLVVSEGETVISGVRDLSGRRLAVEWGSGGDLEARRLARQFADLEIFPLETPLAALDAVRAGQVDAALVDAISAYGYIGRQGGVRVVGEPITDERYIIVVRLDSRQLLREINEALLDFRQAGLFEQLRARWF